jgi:hypothetical protein
MSSVDARAYASENDALFMIFPPLEADRLANERDPERSRKLARGLAQLFGRWPSRG